MSAPVQQPAAPALRPFTDADATASLARATRLTLILGAVGLPLAWFFSGWQSAALLLVGAAISVTGLWEWKRLMTALMARMDAAMPDTSGVPQPYADEVGNTPNQPVRPPSIGFAIAGFSVRLIVVVAVLYASLKYLHGSVIALAVGLGLAVVSLTAEGLRLLRSGEI